MLISSLQNPRIKQLVKLRNRRARDTHKVIVVEGVRAIKMAVDNNIPIKELYFCRELMSSEDNALVERLKGVKLFELSKAVFSKIAYREKPEGILALIDQFDCSLNDQAFKPGGLYLTASAIEKPGNLGTMLRTADALGVDGVICCDTATDVYNPNVVRASMGALFSVPLFIASESEFFAWKNKHSVSLVATTPYTDKRLHEVDLTGAVALAVGKEQTGLSEVWFEQADLQVLIPMKGTVDSFNASVSAAIVLYEATRQRNA